MKKILICIFTLLFGLNLIAQKVIKGKVVDSRNQPIVGVNISEKGSTNQTISGIDGTYSLSYSDKKSIIVFSFDGLKTQEFAVGAKSEINPQMIKIVNKRIRFGFGIGIGLFYPSDINDLILDQNKDVIESTGMEEIIINYSGRAALTFRLNKNFDLSMVAEYTWAPKYLIGIGTDSRYYHFDKFAPGLVAKFHIPMGSGRHSMFIAPGVFYNNLKFVDYSKYVMDGSSLGARIQAGFSFNFGGFNLQPFVYYDYAVAQYEKAQNFELNYSGVQIGVDFAF